MEARPAVAAAAWRAERALDALDRALVGPTGGARAAVVFAESRASCAIEDLVPAAEALNPQGGMGPPPGRTVSNDHALACRRALLAGTQTARGVPLCRRLAEEVCREVTGRAAPLRCGSAVALQRASDGHVVFTPPSGEPLLAALLADWEAAMNDPSVQPLVQMAAGHAQFEVIHPFVDGNGRTGRILNLLSLIARRRLRVPVLCMSDVILRRRDTYYRLLLDVTERAGWEAWTCFMLEVLEEAALWTRQLCRQEAARP